jgi:Fe-S oxidoreductase
MDDIVVIDDFIWEQLIDLTNGAAAVCYQCGTCTATCPWGLVKQKPLSVRDFIRYAQLGMQHDDEGLWLCTTCSQCEVYCPRGVNIADVVRGMRYLAWQSNHPEEGLPTMLWSLHWNNNPWGQPPSQRAQWAKELTLPPFDPNEHEVLYYVGCTTAYDRRAQKIGRSLVSLFNAAGVKFGVLGNEEPCSGEEALSVGHKLYFRDIAAKAVRLFADKGIGKIITTSPHTYDVFQNHYPEVSDKFQPCHYTEFLAELITAGRLSFNLQIEKRVTFQDPCYLARHNDQLAAPRQIIEAIPGVELIEMADNRQDTLCCGGGGGRMWLETAPGERFSDLRVQQALETKADVLVTACPYCISCLEDSCKARGLLKLKVLDVAEIAAMALEPKVRQ